MDIKEISKNKEAEAVELLKKLGYEVIAPTEQKGFKNPTEEELEQLELNKEEYNLYLDGMEGNPFRYDIKELISEEKLQIMKTTTWEEVVKGGSKGLKVFRQIHKEEYAKWVNEDLETSYYKLMSLYEFFLVDILNYPHCVKGQAKHPQDPNSKLEGQICVLNLGSGYGCPYKYSTTNRCFICGNCYAFRDERNNTTLINRCYRALWFFKTPINEIVGEIERRNEPCVRINEAGEIWNMEFQFKKLIIILKLIASNKAIGIYSKNKEAIAKLEALDIPNVAISHSNPVKSKKSFVVVKKEEFDQINDSQKCLASLTEFNNACSDCKRCYTKNNEWTYCLEH